MNNEELQVADQKIEYLRTALTAIVKHIPHSGQNNDIDKRVVSVFNPVAAVNSRTKSLVFSVGGKF